MASLSVLTPLFFFFFFVLFSLSISVPPAIAGPKKKLNSVARKEDIPFIRCQVCQKIAHQIHSQVSAKDSEISPKKVTEYQIIEIVENVCNLKKQEADWILQIDIVENGDKLELVDQGTEGQCNSECKTIERACQEIISYSDTDVAEFVYKKKPSVERLVEYLCNDLSEACSVKPPPVPKKKNIATCSCLPWTHSCGSKSFAATMSTKAEIPHFVDFFKESYWSKKKNDWLDHKCMKKHVELENLRTMCSQPDAIPMSQEEMLVAVLGKKSGYLRGYGVGRKPSNTNTSRRDDEEVIILREELSSIKELNETQQNQLVIQQQQLEAQNEQLMIQQQQIKAQDQKLEKVHAVMLRLGLLSSDQCGKDSPEGC